MNSRRFHDAGFRGPLALLTVIFLLPALEASAAATNHFKDLLLFSSGDRVTGRLTRLQPDGWLGWEHVDAERPILFSTQNIAQIDLDDREGDATAGSAWKVRLDNDDELSARSVGIQGSQILLESWYFGTISVPRGRVRSLTPVQTNFAVVFEGPRGTNGWTSWKVVSALGEPGEWKYQDQAFYAKEAASIARMVNLPDSFSMEFNLKWKGPLNVAIALYTDSLKPISLANKEDEPDFAGFYSLQLNSFGANLLSVKKRDPLRYLGQHSVLGLANKTKAHIEIKADKRSRRILLFVDGVLSKLWAEPGEFSGEGRGIRLVHQGQGGVRLSQLKISEWDGRFEERASTNSAAATGDVVLMLDGERFAGEIQSLNSGEIVLASSSGELRKGVDKVRAIELRKTPAALSPAAKSEEDPKFGSEMQLYFQRHGRLTLKVARIEAGKLVGHSPVMGDVQIDMSAVSRLVFLSK